MNCQIARDSFSDLLDPRPGDAGRAPEQRTRIEAARTHLANCPDCQREFATLSRTAAALDALPTPEPSAHLRRNFYALLEEEKHSAASIRAAERVRRRTSWWRWIAAPVAACALVGLGFVTGTRYAPVRSVTPERVVVADPETRRELQELRAKMDRMEAMNQLVAAAFQQQQRPANERLRGVLSSASEPAPSEPVVNELITSLALDSSVNVRLRALDALYALSDRADVRAGVLASLARETNPLVQVAMIDFLAAARDADARPALERIAGSETIDANVREAAKRAVAQL